MALVEPYYERNGITIYNADCRDVLPHLDGADTIITDPVWPNSARSGLVGSDDPYTLLSEAAQHWPAISERAVVQIGCDSDPRILLAIPEELRFFRVVSLEYTRPTYKGNKLYTGDMAYCFGRYKTPKWRGANVIPGRMTDNSKNGRTPGHPAPRRLAHLRWLVSWLSAPEDVILDPFMGIGTTLVAAKFTGRRAIGIEIVEEFCERAVKRLAQEVMV